MIYKIYDFQCEVNKFLYGLGKGHQQCISESILLQIGLLGEG